MCAQSSTKKEKVRMKKGTVEHATEIKKLNSPEQSKRRFKVLGQQKQTNKNFFFLDIWCDG